MASARRANWRRENISAGAGCACRGCDVMTLTDALLLAVSVAVFAYLGIAIFKPEWF